MLTRERTLALCCRRCPHRNYVSAVSAARGSSLLAQAPARRGVRLILRPLFGVPCEPFDVGCKLLVDFRDGPRIHARGHPLSFGAQDVNLLLYPIKWRLPAS